MAKEHWLVDKDLKTIESRHPYVATDGNHGLPDSYFENDLRLINFEVDGDVVQWWPAMGPAPHWSEKLSTFNGDIAAMVDAFLVWIKETY